MHTVSVCAKCVGSGGGGVCGAGDNHSPPDSGFYDTGLEQSVNVLSDSTPGLQPHNCCLCDHFTAVCLLKTAIRVTLQTVLFALALLFLFSDHGNATVVALI